MENMTPSHNPITRAQVGKFQDILGSALIKSRISSKDAQMILEVEGEHITNDFLEIIKKYRKILCPENMTISLVSVNREIPQEEVLSNISMDKCLGKEGLIGKLPTSKARKVKIFFFQVQIESETHISDDQLELEYELRGLKPVDPFALIQANVDDHRLHEEYPNATHWRNAEGIWCAAMFDPTGNGPILRLHQHVVPWNTEMRWFAGVKR